MESIEIRPTESSYPAPLRELVTETGGVLPPLYLRGALPSVPGIAIVGTRAASDEAIRFTRELASALGTSGFAIWSGGARGIDAAAHEGALEAGVPTVMVGGSGHARPYPREHAELFARIVAAGGALLACVPDDKPPLPLLFLQRNAVLAALTVATVVVEAGIESGARSTAAAARRLGRHLCVVPRAPWDPRGIGCALELVAGARVITRAADVLASVNGTPPPRRSPTRRRSRGGAGAGSEAELSLPGLGRQTQPILPEYQANSALSAEERAVLNALGSGLAHVDEVCERTGLPSYRAVEALLTLTLQAVVVEGPAGLFRRTLR